MKLALLIEYDGTDFAGWQVQPGVRTVQGELERAVQKITGRELSILGSGRTDTGVHATGMVAHLELPEDLEVELPRFILGLNATSGYDVVIKDARPVAADFNARFTAISRSYRYTISSHRTALWRRHAWEFHRPLDLQLLTECSTLLMGEHDFTSFSKASEDVAHFRCNILDSGWESDGTQFAFRITANRFVRGMVRALVGAQVQVGSGGMTLEAFRSALDSPQELHRAKDLAPPQGLILERVAYPDQFGLW